MSEAKTFRSDIQGLRALAVGLVVVFHLLPSKLTGGYIGVDIFFVISGYLITSHILREVETTGRLNVVDFWARRVRRLLPASLLVLLVSLAAAILVLPRATLIQTATEIGGAAAYVLNWVLAANSVDYLATDNIASIVQHYWSLSTEEQFYLVWPLLIAGAVWLASRRRREGKVRMAVAAAVSLVFVASLAWSVYFTGSSPAEAYFVTTTRAWEFAAGAVVALLPLSLRFPPAVHLGVSWVAFAAIAAAAVTFDADTAFPGYAALLPVVATMLLLVVGDSASEWSPQYVARFAPVRYLGDISYSVYLWHWPLIIVFTAVRGHSPGWKWAIVLIAVTIVLAALTKKFVEDPIRRARGWIRKPRWSIVLAVGSALVMVGASGIARADVQGEIDRFDAQIAALLENQPECFGANAILNDCAEPYAVTDTVVPWAMDESGFGTTGIGNWSCTWKQGAIRAETTCHNGASNTDRIALWGDSHAEQYLASFRNISEHNGVGVDIYTKAACPALGRHDEGEDEEATACEGWREDILKRIVDDPATSTVVITGRFEVRPIGDAQVSEVFSALQSAGKRVIFVRDLPGMAHEYGLIDESEPALTCIESNLGSYDPCSWTPDSPWDDWGTIAARDAGIPMIDPWELVCPDGTCHSVIGGVSVYVDRSHVSSQFAETMGAWFQRQLEALEAI